MTLSPSMVTLTVEKATLSPGMVTQQNLLLAQGERRARKPRLCCPPSPLSRAALAPPCRHADVSAHPRGLDQLSGGVSRVGIGGSFGGPPQPGARGARPARAAVRARGAEPRRPPGPLSVPPGTIAGLRLPSNRGRINSLETARNLSSCKCLPNRDMGRGDEVEAGGVEEGGKTSTAQMLRRD